MAKAVRKIVRIDEEKCNGCGACTSRCAEGALRLVNGKARLTSENYCDGLGACLGECPTKAIFIEDRLADNFDEAAVERHLHQTVSPTEKSANIYTSDASVKAQPQLSTLRHWPLQLALVPPGAPFLQHADVLLTADCVPFACAGFHQKLLKGHAVIIACPKLDDNNTHLAKLIQILKDPDFKSLTIARMEVPCCGGLTHLAKNAVAACGKSIPVKEVVIGIRGGLMAQA